MPRISCHRLFLPATVLLLLLTSVLMAQARTIDVGVYENKPKIFTDSTGHPRGFFVDVIEEIARRENWKVNYVMGTWAECLVNLEQGVIQLMPDVAYSPDREKRWSFNQEPVLSDWFQVYVNKGSGIKSIVDLVGKKVAVLDQSVQQEAFNGYLRKFGFECEIVPLPDYDHAFKLLEDGKVDATITNRFYGYGHHILTGMEETAIIFRPTSLHFAAPRGSSPEVLDAIDSRLVQMKKDPRSVYNQSLNRWFGDKMQNYKTPQWLLRVLALLAVTAFLFLTVALLLKRKVAAKTGQLVRLSRDLAKEIDERAEIEQNLRLSEEKYRELFENAPNGYLIVDPDGFAIKRCNQTAARLLGVRKEVLESMKLSDLYSDVSDDLRSLISSLSDFPLVSEELQLVRGNGDLLWVSIAIDNTRDANGSVIECRVMLTDISARKKIETQMLHVQKMEALGVLAGGISHDFNNILSAIIGYAELAREGAGDPQMIDDIEEIIKAGIRAKHLVEQILAFSRQSKYGELPIQPKPIVKEVLKLLRASLPTTIEISSEIISDAYIHADPTKIHQIMMNLCTNAGHAMESRGGVLHVALLEKEIDDELQTLTGMIPPGRYLQLQISDNGEGIPVEIMGQIFDPFYTTKVPGKGTGMGLAVVHGIVTASHGGILLDSRVGAGTTFEILLPIVEGTPVEETLTRPEMPITGGNILFIDDEPTLADLGRHMLGKLGFEVTALTSPLEALKLFGENPDYFDLVITDLTMPGLTGDKLAAELRRSRKEIPIILCTGHSNMFSNEKIGEAGFDEILIKPLEQSVLVAAISRVLSRAGHQSH